MKKIILILLIHLLICGISINLLAQINCNQSVTNKRLAKHLPKEVCIPNGYIISYIYDNYDLNNDGLLDFIFKWRKKELNDGDTIFVTIYKQNTDSSFSQLKTLNNLYPIFFQRYDSNYTIQNSIINKLKSNYNGFYPFKELLFETNFIILKFETEAYSGYSVYWKYNNYKKDWFLDSIIRWDNILQKNNGLPVRNIDKTKSIEEFSYFDYL